MVEAHALWLVSERARVNDELLDLVVPVKGEGLAEEAAEEPVRVWVVGAKARHPKVLVGQILGPEFAGRRLDG